jgi:GAF domain-containing protein
MIAGYVKDVIGADRCSIYIYDKRHEKLWTTLADGIERVVIDAGRGIVGATLQARKPLIVNDPYNDDRFYKEIDRQTGYITSNLASVPIFNSNREIIGVLQLLNKEGDFDREDTRFMVFFAHYVSGYLELACLFNSSEA